MLFSRLAFALAATSTSAFSITEFAHSGAAAFKRFIPSKRSPLPIEERGGNCPAVWTSIASDLTAMFLDTSTNPSQCNDDARAAIREAFHDCGSWETSLGATGGCDGSLILSVGNDELGRGENNGLQDISGKLLALQNKWVAVDPSVTVADVIQFAASVAIVTCPGGPQIKTFVGRKDSTTPAKGSLLPDVFAGADDLYALFQRKGLSASELAALLGAHSTSKQFHVPGAPVNASQDSTPGLWDVKYYAETLSPPSNVYVFPSDAKLAVHPTVGKEFKAFVGGQAKWTAAFGAAMTKMSLFGVAKDQKMIDCTSAVPRGTSKRDMRASPINDRVR
ncbi:hypothetical protein ONS95_008884 [Cadophora gregata]|uniref:uncharacterized protein n=1 Tax=Cadophora gregata TaxID=51156 RepID=UPI0026DD6D40|nr:uncharacterized protein ONS95_008884 [Cadophora gregata]KAK0123891.1 hypothetical protein ONS95_008884 [Cadophora gregata]KAK0130232.1 hypothetical protein ONS96_000755 [Cadophora gregata f. sp. sojae]